jgi:hypothetical protein
MKWLRTIALSVGLHAAASAATGTSVNVSDHWWSEGESGWGLSITQQDDIAFVALYVYGDDRQPVWYTATGVRYGQDMAGNPGFQGALYRTTGPHHGGPFDPGQVQGTPVGTLTFEATGPARAILVYDVAGVQVTKAMTRFTFRVRDWTGLYRGVQRANYRDCVPGFTPAFTYDDGLVDVEHEGSAFRMWFEGKKATCMYTGTYAQHGRLGRVTGNYACADGPSGTFTLDGLETNQKAFAARIDTSHPSCGAATHDLAGLLLD